VGAYFQWLFPELQSSSETGFIPSVLNCTLITGADFTGLTSPDARELQTSTVETLHSVNQLQKHTFNPLTGTLEPQSNGRTVIQQYGDRYTGR